MLVVLIFYLFTFITGTILLIKSIKNKDFLKYFKKHEILVGIVILIDLLWESSSGSFMPGLSALLEDFVDLGVFVLHFILVLIYFFKGYFKIPTWELFLIFFLGMIIILVIGGMLFEFR